jgi:tetratricopeptide (TPR) repeat protein
MKSGFLRGIFGLAVLALGFGAQAVHATPFNPSAEEFSVLPAFCKAKLGADPNNVRLYADSIGPDWLHIHHYCFGLGFTNKFFKDFGNSMAQRDDVKQAVSNYDYVLEHAAPDFWMRAEIGTQKARILQAAKHNVEAIDALDIALKANADYAPAYALLSDIYRDMNQKQKALEAVEKGLQRVPLDKPLQRRYKTLSGKVFVVPASAMQAPAKTTPDPAATAKPDAAAAAVNKPATDAAAVPDKIGVPGNPYCRFCP